MRTISKNQNTKHAFGRACTTAGEDFLGHLSSKIRTNVVLFQNVVLQICTNVVIWRPKSAQQNVVISLLTPTTTKYERPGTHLSVPQYQRSKNTKRGRTGTIKIIVKVSGRAFAMSMSVLGRLRK